MKTPRVGRPPLPKSQRKSSQHAFRLNAAGEAQLTALKRAINADESETIRRALDALAAQVGVSASGCCAAVYRTTGARLKRGAVR